MNEMVTSEKALEILVLDDFLKFPEEYRAMALDQSFKRIDFGHIAFNGIALAPLTIGLPRLLQRRFPHLVPELSVFRRSPAGQKEPNFIHCDIELGEWTAILYLNPRPMPGDGTDFWEHAETHEIRGTAENAVEKMKDRSRVFRWRHIKAKFNRVVMFPADLFHSRALYDNYGSGDDARLIQVVFGNGSLE